MDFDDTFKSTASEVLEKIHIMDHFLRFFYHNRFGVKLKFCHK